jgi:hypothetical protein
MFFCKIIIYSDSDSKVYESIYSDSDSKVYESI